MLLLTKIKKYFRSVAPPYSRADVLPVSLTLLLLSAGPLALPSVAQTSVNPRIEIISEEEVEDQDIVEFATNEVLFKVKKSARGRVKEGKGKDTGIPSLNSVVKGAGAEIAGVRRLAKVGKNSQGEEDVFSWYLLELSGNREIAQGKLDSTLNRFSADHPAAAALSKVIQGFKEDSNIEAAEPNFQVNIVVDPNDPFYSSSGSWGQSNQDMWGLHMINSAGGWDQTTGSSDIIVAIIDTGVDGNHPDLASNMWVNEGEIPNNNIDDDNNGYVDDYNGWNWFTRNKDSMDDHGHGTHTAGTVGAIGNNDAGVVGVNWSVKIMPLRFLGGGGWGGIADGISALQYAADMGAHISSNSWGCNCNSQGLQDAIDYQHSKGMVVVAAAGNSSSDPLDFAPASYDKVITVGATDSNDTRAIFSNWGQRIDVSAPGVDILSLKSELGTMCGSTNTVQDDYCYVSGTSMAAPHVAGLAALLLAKDQSLTNEEVRQLIRVHSDDVGFVVREGDFGYGRINIGQTLSFSEKPLAPIITSPRTKENIFGETFVITGGITGSNFSNYRVEVGAGRNPTSWRTLATSSTQIINGELATVDVLSLDEGLNTFRLTATNTSGESYEYKIYDVVVDNFDGEITYPITIFPIATIDIIGSAQTLGGEFVKYTLEWGNGLSPSSFSSSGIVLENGGNQPVVGGKLATWDTSNFIHYQRITLRLTVESTTTSSVVSSIIANGDPDLIVGWPKVLDGGGYTPYQSPAMGDMNGDGVKEVVFLASAGDVHVFNRDGTDFSGFPVSIESGFSFDLPPSVMDLDGDGSDEIIATAMDMESGNPIRRIYIFKGDGSIYPGWPVDCTTCTFENRAVPAVSDLDLDGVKELVYLGSDSLHAISLDGKEISGFPKLVVDLGIPAILNPERGNIAIDDLDNDGIPEIAYVNGYNQMVLLDNKGDFLPGWPHNTQRINNELAKLTNSPAFGDVDGDGVKEIVTLGLIRGCSGCNAIIYIWEKDGSLVSGWPVLEGSIVYAQSASLSNRHTVGNLSLGDLDGDGKDEIIVAGDKTRIYDVDGKKFEAIGYSHITPSIGDVDGDGKLEFSHVSPKTGGSELGIVDDDGLSWYWSRSLARLDSSGNIVRGNLIINSTPVMADLDNNGKVELAAVEVPIEINYFPTSEKPIPEIMLAYLWEIPADKGTASGDWPMYAHDSSLTGNTRTNVVPGRPPDVEAPSAPENLTAISISHNQVDLAWDESTDNVGVAGYRVFRDGNMIADGVTSTLFGDSTVTPSTTHAFHVVAYDAKGNVSANSNTISVDVLREPSTEGIVFGVVSKAVDGSIISEVTVEVTDPSLKGKSAKIATSTTNSEGNYAITLSPGTYDITVSKKGYDKQIAKAVVVEADKNIQIDFALEGGKSGGGKPGGPGDDGGGKGKKK